MFPAMTSLPNYRLFAAIDQAKLLNRHLQYSLCSRTLHWQSLACRFGDDMVRFIEIAAPTLIVGYLATYLAMRYFFPPEVRRWGISRQSKARVRQAASSRLIKDFAARDHIPDLGPGVPLAQLRSRLPIWP
jgi:hypothetical protein